MAWPSWMPLAARPSNWRDWPTIFKDVIPREWPARLFQAGAEAYHDLIALGESLALARDVFAHVQHNLWPQEDDDMLFISRWESAFGFQADGTDAERIQRIIAAFRQRGTMTMGAWFAIILKAWGLEDPSLIAYTMPTVADVVATETLGASTYMRAFSFLHIYLVAETSDPDLSLKNDLIATNKPTWETWFAGKYQYGLYGSTATNTIYGRYNGCTYDTRPSGSYGKLCEGNRIWTSASTGGIYFEDYNELNDQLAGMFGESSWNLGVAGIAETDWVADAANDPPRWMDSSANGDILIIPFSPKAGMLITQIDLIIGGNAESGDTPEGAIELVRLNIQAGASYAVVATYTPVGKKTWEQGGIGPIKISITSINHTVGAGWEYAVRLTSVGGGGGGDECAYYGGVVYAQFGN